MSEHQDRRLPINDEGVLRTFTKWISSHEEGIAEWLKNVRRAYREDRANVADEHRATLILMMDATGDSPARLGVLDVGGATLEDVERWSVWQDYTASGGGSNLSEEKTQGNGSKAYMYRLFSGRARILGVKDGKLNCKGFEGPAQSLDRGFPRFLPDEESARELPISKMEAQLAEALRPYNIRIEELPAALQDAIRTRRSFTLVEGVGPNLYKGRINVKDLIAKLLRHDQVTAVIEQVRIFATHNGRPFNGGSPLQLEAIEPYPGLEQSRAFEIPESLRDSDGNPQSTTLQGTRPGGRVILLTSRDNMRLAHKKLLPRWKISYRAPNHPIGSKPVSDFVPGVPGADFIYGIVELSAFEPDYVEPGRKRPLNGPLVSAVDLFIADRIRELAKEINDRRRQALDEKTLDEVQRENRILDRFKNQFLASVGPSGPGASTGGGGGKQSSDSPSDRDYGIDPESILLQWESERILRIGRGVAMHAEAIFRPRILDPDGRYVPSAELDWFTKDRHVFEFSDSDLGRAIGKGGTFIWCRVRGTSIQSEQIPVEVCAVDHVLLTPRTLLIPLGRREQISAQVTNDDGERATDVMLNWSHDAPDQLVVRITPWGVVTGNRLGRTCYLCRGGQRWRRWCLGKNTGRSDCCSESERSGSRWRFSKAFGNRFGYRSNNRRNSTIERGHAYSLAGS